MNSCEIKPLKETGVHSYHRRAFKHDYFAPFIYHIILKKSSNCESFGKIVGDARIAPGLPGSAKVDESSLGQVIAKSILYLPHMHLIIKLHQFCVMPDHVHILLQVLYRSDKHLDFYIDSLKRRIASKYAALTNRVISVCDIFEAGYCDKPLYSDRSLDDLYVYIRENPHRLAMRQQFPHFFRRIRTLKIDNEEFEAYGNLFLFRNPDKRAVKISRKFTRGECLQLKADCLAAASHGSILISPFIHDFEKKIRAESEAIGANIILIVHEAFPEKYKPHAHDFALCEQGRLLIISLGLPAKTELTRGLCMRMNKLAATLAAESNEEISKT